MMLKKLALMTLASSLVVGCASVPMESADKSKSAKAFNAPAAGNAGLYIYRSSGPGGALKKDVWVDGQCIGETAPDVFFYKEVAGGSEHKISTESEFSPNDLLLKTESGKIYFVKQYIKVGVFVGGAGLENVSDTKGKLDVSKLDMAVGGHCSK